MRDGRELRRDRFRCGACDRACGLSACVASDCDDVLSISGTSSHSCAVLRSGRVLCWGENEFGRIGDGTAVDRFVAVEVLTDGVQVSASQSHTCAARTDGTVACWGDNSGGALGDGTTTNRYIPTPVPGLTGVAQVDAAYLSTCERTVAGAVWCWGAIMGSTSPVLTPFAGAIEIAISVRTACARRADGTVVCYGDDSAGQRGDGASTTPADAAPTLVSGLNDAVELAAGQLGHFCARRATGAVVCWGVGNDGTLGDGRNLASPVPVQAIAAGAVTIAASARTSCAALDDGTLWCWGSDGGVLPATSSAVPVLVASDRLAAILGAGEGHLCVLAPTGALECRGYGGSGQLGAGPTITESAVFIPLALP